MSRPGTGRPPFGGEGTTPHRSNLDPVDIYIGFRLRRRRTMAGISLGDMAHALGVAPHDVLRHEKGVLPMDIATLHAAAQVLRVSADYFFDGYEEIKDRGLIDSLRDITEVPT